MLLTLTLARTGARTLFTPDTASYLVPGRNLLLHARYFDDGLPLVRYTPVYPLFLALTSLPGPVFASVAQIALSVLSVVLVWRLARATFGDDRIALTSAWIFAFEPLSVISSVLLISETLFLTFFLLSMERLGTFLREHRLRTLAVAGIWLAAATFVRPVTYYLPIALAAGLFLTLTRVPGLRWKAPAVLLVSVLPWLAAWQIRNRVETGFGGFTCTQTEILYFWSAAGVTARVEHLPFRQVQADFGYDNEAVFLTMHPEAAGWSQGQRFEFMHSESDRILRAHPQIFLQTQLEGTLRVLLSPIEKDLWSLLGCPIREGTFRVQDLGMLRGALQLAEENPWQAGITAALGVWLLVLYLFAALGAVRGNVQGACLWLLLGTSLYFLAVSGGPTASGRYRLPMMPAVCMLAAAGALARKPGATNLPQP
jgi:hypothetical protein